MSSMEILPDNYLAFGKYIKEHRVLLGKSIRGLAAELGITPAYLSDIEKGNRYAPEKHLPKIADILKISGDDIDCFYDLAGKNRKDKFPDLTPYIGENQIVRIALRKARDLSIPDSKWQVFIDDMGD